MSVAFVQQFDNIGQDKYDAVRRELGLDRIGARCNAFRIFAVRGRFSLYWPAGIGTYPEDASPFPDQVPSARRVGQVARPGAQQFSRGVGSTERRGGWATPAASTRTATARAGASVVAGADLSRPARRGHAGRAFPPVVRRAAVGQFVGGPAGPVAVGRVYGPDAADVASLGDPPAPPRGVLAPMARGGARRHAIQSAERSRSSSS